MAWKLTKRSKYGAKRCEIDGIKFDSLKEGKRYVVLKQLERVGEIADLKVHERFNLHALAPIGMLTGVPDPIGQYEADFTYRTNAGERVVEDCKGFRTDLYKWKKKHLKAQYGIDILET